MSYPDQFGFRAVGQRIAVDQKIFRKIRVEPEQALLILSGSSLNLIPVNATHQVVFCRSARYQRGAPWRMAPSVVDCSSLVKWLYGEMGIWLPRRTIQQRRCGFEVDRKDIRQGDLIFTSGRKDYFTDDPADGVGHVGIKGSFDLVVHAANKELGVIETPLKEFIKDGFRGARRIVADMSQLWVFEDLKNRGIEVSDDLVWIVAQQL